MQVEMILLGGDVIKRQPFGKTSPIEAPNAETFYRHSQLVEESHCVVGFCMDPVIKKQHGWLCEKHYYTNLQMRRV